MNWQSTLSFNENIQMTIDWYIYYTSKNTKEMRTFSKKSNFSIYGLN